MPAEPFHSTLANDSNALTLQRVKLLLPASVSIAACTSSSTIAVESDAGNTITSACVLHCSVVAVVVLSTRTMQSAGSATIVIAVSATELVRSSCFYCCSQCIAFESVLSKL
jgi:hypothetical protein